MRNPSRTDQTVERIVTALERIGLYVTRKKIKQILQILALEVRVFAKDGAIGDRFYLPDLLTLELCDRPVSTYRNPRTRAKITVPAGRKLKIKLNSPLRKLS